MKKVGFIGLGIMGKPMSLNLLKGGIEELFVFDLNKDAVKTLVEAGAKEATVSEIGSKCDVIFTILPNGAVVQNVLFGENGVVTNIKKGSLVCDLSSVTPVESKFCSDKLAELDVDFLDSPVSGGEPKAIDGTLAFMVGGTEEAFEKAKPYMEIMGESYLLIGPVGSGVVTKLANQIIVNMTIATISEAFVLAKKAGADPAKVYEAIKGGLAGSTVLDAKIPLIINRQFKPGGKISINHKDIKNVLATGHDIDCPLPLSAQLFEILQSLKVKGHFEDDHSAIVQYFENLAGVEVK